VVLNSNATCLNCAAASQVQFSSGTMGPGVITVTGVFTHSTFEVTNNATLYVAPSAIANYTDSALYVTNGGLFLNNGTWNWYSTDEAYIDSNSSVVNWNVLNVMYTSSHLDWFGLNSLPGGAFYNLGLFNLPSTASYVVYYSGDFYNCGNGVLQFGIPSTSNFPTIQFNNVHLDGSIAVAFTTQTVASTLSSNYLSLFTWSPISSSSSASGYKMFNGLIGVLPTIVGAIVEPLTVCWQPSNGYALAYGTSTFIGLASGTCSIPNPISDCPAWAHGGGGTTGSSTGSAPGSAPGSSPGSAPSGTPGSAPSGTPGSAPSGTPGSAPSGTPGSAPSVTTTTTSPASYVRGVALLLFAVLGLLAYGTIN